MPFSYDRQAAVDYAHRWAFARNPRYASFDAMGGDCTNFASQCLFVGCGRMNYTKDFGWYYIDLRRRAPAWTGVVYLYRFLTRAKGPGPCARIADISGVRPGDLVQLRFAHKADFSHSPVIVRVEMPEPAGIFVASHSDDCDERPLNTYAYADCRFLHVDRVQ